MSEDGTMQRIDGRFVYSASDLNNALECEHLTELEAMAARHELIRPEPSDTAALLARKGDEHEERQFARYCQLYGSEVIAFPSESGRTVAALSGAQEAAIAAMDAGAPFIYQATFFDGTFLGRTDFLRRVERPCARWAWSYEVIDAKLALTPKPYYLVQLAHYSAHLAAIQGCAPRDMHVLLGSGAERAFRVDDFAAYERHLRARFLAKMAGGPNATYPLEVAHCDVCRWHDRCAQQRLADDHLSLVARIRRDQIRRLESAGITTMTQLANGARPFGMEERTFTNLQGQAALQVIGRREDRYVYELLDADEGTGFEFLPQPDPGDLFFDIEGDPLYAPERGLEYLFGFYSPGEGSYVSFWARSATQERAAFEAAIDFMCERRKRYPGMHIYHYASYETSALRRLMGFYGTRERQLDDLLRGQTFVDLFAVVRQTLRISQPSYSLKKLEPYYGMRRSTDVRRGDDSIVMFETWLAGGSDAILDDIERYNADDCRSTHLLRDWLLERRAEYQMQCPRALAWRETESVSAPDDEARGELAAQLLDAVVAPSSLRELRASDENTRAKWLLGHLLDYHAREAKPVYWKYYDRIENVDRLLEFDHEALGGLRLREDIERYKLTPRDRNFVYTYTFPDQLHNLGTDKPYCPHTQGPAGSIVLLDDDRNELRIKLHGSIRPDRLRALIPGKPLQTNEQREALSRIAQAYLEGTLARTNPAALSLLLARRPRTRTARDCMQPETVDTKSVGALIADLDESHLAIQGPPGSGKSTLAAAVICDLLAAGNRVGIVAGGHKAIHNLLHKIEACTIQTGRCFRGLQKYSSTTEGSQYVSEQATSWIEATPDNSAFDGAHDLAAGTSWLFARPEMAGRYDYLFIDEAGQMSLADALACSVAARNVVLLGDPLQLKSVSQGSHPPGTDLSILQHLLGAHETIDPRDGIFLDRSYRMAPSICAFISHAVYEDRLLAAADCARNRVDAPGWEGNGLRFLGVAHDGNTRSSDEEAGAVANAARELLRGTVTIGEGAPRAMEPRDLIVVSPYNAQRKLIRKRLEEAGFPDIRVGTVDKFQGQEAAVVLYSMATSNDGTLPRDLEFLFERNRLNVAISRAQCLSVLVCSPELLSVRCSTPEQMALVNLLCAFVEDASSAAAAA